jgi:diguanylate cyclase (GGDEF)-like protein/PAS domain S-box-containing protein
MLTQAKQIFITRKVKIVATLVLALFAVVANSLNVPLFYGVDFIFGSIFVMLAFVLLGIAPAVFVALVGGLVTLFLWGHPYALIIFIVEIVVVSQLLRRGICDLMVADLAYWLLIGVPLILFFYYVHLGMGWQNTFLISLKQPLNGLFNTLMAAVILIIAHLFWPKLKSLGLKSLRITNLLFHTLLVTLFLAGGLAIVYDSVSYRTLQEDLLVESLTLRTANLIKELEVNPRVNISLELESDMAIAVVTNDGRILASQGKIVSNTVSTSQLTVLNNNLSIWLPVGMKSVMQRMMQGRYIVRIPLNDTDTASYLIIEQSAISLASKLKHRGVTLLLLLVVFLVFAIIVSFVISQLLTRALNEIEITSRNLSKQIANGENLTFPNSEIEEYASLSGTLKDVAKHLILSFESLRQHEIALEDKVKLKTSELRESQARLTFAVEGAGDGVWDWNLHTNAVQYSPLWMSMLGYQHNELPQHLDTFTSLLHHDDSACTMQALQDFITGKIAALNVETRFRCKDGNYKWILSRGMIVSCDNDNEPSRIVGTHTDISHFKENEEKLKLASTVFTHTRESIIITDATGNIIDVNETFCEIRGYSREDVIGQNPRILESGRESPEFYTAMWEAANKKGYWVGKIWNRRKNGEVFPENLTLNAVKDVTGKVSHYVALFSDITNLNNAHQSQLKHMAHYDALTKLPNRVLLDDRLRQAILQSHYQHNSLAVVFLDLDDFKPVNDTHGHAVGDELLMIVSDRMQEALRNGDTLARIGGDEFVAVLANLANFKDCQQVLERLLLAVSEPIKAGEIGLNVSASIGVTLYPKDGVEAGILIRHADQAMYQAKQAGKNCYHFFDSALDDAVNIKWENINNITKAVNRREFVLHYQPKVNMSTGEVVGVEALIRWQHPTRGLVQPLDFLPMIENHPISLDIGEWVIDTALSQISQWQSMGITLPISVNISAYQLQKNNFVERLTALLAKYPDVSPNNLELEILETSALSDVIQVSATMKSCIELGVNFALDDFGTGYSSLTYLRRLPACLIKIDQSFIRDMLDDADDLAIVTGVISLAKAFEREVIGEGVETIEHGTTLLKLGCELAQGYGIAKPMSASCVLVWMKSWKPDISWVLPQPPNSP